MKVVTSSPATISIDELAEKLLISNDLIVYYRTNNEKDGLPVFLKRNIEGHLWGFISPIDGYKTTFEHHIIYKGVDTLKEFLTKVSKIRTLYVINSRNTNEVAELFKPQP